MRHHIYGSAKSSAQCDAQCKLIKRHTKRHPYSNANANSGSTVGLSFLRLPVRLRRHVQTPVRVHDAK
jgi:hypothetical protein